MKKAVIYARVSTAEQAEEGYSIDAQIDTVKRKCILEGREVICEYIDRGISGKSISKRLQLQKLLEEAKQCKFDEVWVWKTNRLARNHLDLLKIVDHLSKYNIGFKSCSEAFDTSTPSGKLLMNVLASIGEFERETIVENVKMGMKQRARTGKWNGGQVLGYKSVVSTDDENKTRLVIEEKEANIVRIMFQLYSEGKGFKSIANFMNNHGYKSKKGNLFSIVTIKEILLNPIYTGTIRYNLRENWNEKRRRGINKNPIIVDGEHDAIISKELWDKVQEIYNQKSHKPQRIFDGSYPLSGILKCPVCGSSMVAGRSKKKHKDGTYKIHRYYYCGAWRNKGISACRSNAIRADEIEQQVFNRIWSVLLNDRILNDIVNKMNEKRQNTIKPLESQLNQINKSISDLENRKNKIFELYEDSIIDKETLANRLKTTSTEINDYILNKEEILDKLKSHSSERIEFKVVKQLMSKFNVLLQNSDLDKQKTLLHLVINKIIVKDRKNIQSIILQFNNSAQKNILGIKEGESSEEDSPSFSFLIEI